MSAPDIRGNEREYVRAVIDSNWVAPAGPELDKFERSLACVSGREYAVALSSGTAAIHLALLDLGVSPGDVVLCSSLTFAGSANPIAYCGAVPVFIDSEWSSWNMDPDLLQSYLKRCVKSGLALPAAAVVVDLYGNCADYGAIVPLLEEYEIPIVEDAAEAIGSSRDGAVAGSHGQHAVLSFNGNKLITTGGGGAIVTDSKESAERARYLSTQARQPAVHYEHTEIGYNYRMSSIAAAFGRAQLESLTERIDRRREITDFYAEFARELGISLLAAPGESNHWLTCGTFDGPDGPAQRDNLIRFLETQNIESRPVWKPMHMQPVFAGCMVEGGAVSEALFRVGLCLPSGSGLTDAELERVRAAMLRYRDEIR